MCRKDSKTQGDMANYMAEHLCITDKDEDKSEESDDVPEPFDWIYDLGNGSGQAVQHIQSFLMAKVDISKAWQMALQLV